MDFNPNTDKVAYADMSEFDKWALLRLEEVRQRLLKVHENYEFHVCTMQFITSAQ